MIYLGTLGRMVGIKCPASQRLDAPNDPTFRDTLEGRRFAFPKQGIPRRTWRNQLSDASTPAQVGSVMSFINGEWGAGPFAFVSADAPVTNMLTPSAAACDPADVILGGSVTITGTPPMLTPEGWVGRSFMMTTVNSVFFGRDLVPILAGQRVTASAYVLGAGGAVRLTWNDAAGSSMTTVTSTVVSTAGTAVRSYLTAMPPAGAVSCRISTTASTTQATRPAITWSDGLLEWGDGQGCPKAVIHSASRDLVLASRDPRGGRYSNLSFTVSEVG